MDNQERAQDLRRRLNDHALDIELLARDAVAVFDAAGGHAYQRWLGLELDGYGSAVDRTPLYEVLGVPEGDRLVAHVSAYRGQPGHVREPAECTFRHFFVESLHDLSAAAQRLRGAGTHEVRLDFSPEAQGYPAAAFFSGDVFDRILLGFRAALHLQLGSIAP